MLVPMAAAGLDVIGLDLSPIMLAGARRRARLLGTPVRLILGDMRRFAFARSFALIFVAVNSLLHLTRTQDLRSCFASVRQALRPDGRFVFDIYNFGPSRLAGAPGRRRQVGRYLSPAHGPLLIEELCRYDAATQLLHRTWFHSTPGSPDFRVVEFAVRVVFPEELRLLLEVEGLKLEARYGDLDCSPFCSDSPSQVCVARCVAGTGWRG
jgi:SAM-dependent methyltransferase